MDIFKFGIDDLDIPIENGTIILCENDGSPLRLQVTLQDNTTLPDDGQEFYLAYEDSQGDWFRGKGFIADRRKLKNTELLSILIRITAFL